MRKNQVSIDGFIPRKTADSSSKKVGTSQEVKASQPKTVRKPVKRQSKPSEVDDLELALETLEVEDQPKKSSRQKREIAQPSKSDKRNGKKLLKRNEKRSKKGKKPLSMSQFKRRRNIKRFFTLIILICAIVAGIYAWRVLNSTGNVLGGNILDIFKQEKLKADSQGRTNVLVFATNPDDRAAADSDNGLTDSIMVVSVNQETKDIYTVSLPRDLYVKHTCSSYLGTTAGKLNETYVCGEKDAEAEGLDEKAAEIKGQEALMSTAGSILGLDIQYAAHLNWEVLYTVVDSLGGIDVKVEAYDGSAYVSDPGYTKIHYKSGETYHMNGEQALAFSRARHGSGLTRSNFDRELNQQKVMKAIVDKFNSSGKNNPLVLLELVSSLGDNIKTTFQTSEVQTLANIAKDFKADSIKSLPLVKEGDNDVDLIGDGPSGVIPKAGMFEYSEIHKYIAKKTISDPVIKEEAQIVVLNGTMISGYAAEQSKKLEEEGYTIIDVDSAPEQDYKKTKVYKLNENKPKTFEKLTKKFKAGADDTAPSWTKQYATADIIIVIGDEEE